jgi:transcription antitermination factor NusG
MRSEDKKGQGEPKDSAALNWYALYTRSHCEQLVYNQLSAKSFRVFLPKVDTWSQCVARHCLVLTPLFPSYLFLQHVMDKESYIQVQKVRGLVRILGERWDRLGVVSALEIETIQKILNARLPVLPHPYLKEGQRVRITFGPLAGVEGVFVQSNPAKGMVVLSVDLLQRSLAVEVECSLVVAA